MFFNAFLTLNLYCIIGQENEGNTSANIFIFKLEELRDAKIITEEHFSKLKIIVNESEHSRTFSIVINDSNQILTKEEFATKNEFLHQQFLSDLISNKKPHTIEEGLKKTFKEHSRKDPEKVEKVNALLRAQFSDVTFSFYDVDKNNQIDLWELYLINLKLKKLKEIQTKSIELIYDKNKNGKLETGEKAVLQKDVSNGAFSIKEINFKTLNSLHNEK